MLKKLFIKTNFVFIGVIVIFLISISVSINQVLGDTTTVPGMIRTDNLTVNTGGQYTNGFVGAKGNALVAGSIGVGTITPTAKLDVVGNIKSTTGFCIGSTCIDENQLKKMLGVGGIDSPVVSQPSTEPQVVVPEPQVTIVTNPVDVFLIAGQSNAVGYGDSSESPLPPTGKVLTYYNGTISNTSDPVGNAKSGSAWPAFGNTYYEKTNHVVVFVPSAVGGASQVARADSGSGTWDESGKLFNTSMSTLDSAMVALSAAGYTPMFKGILWDQGETDAIGINNSLITENDYKNALLSMISRYRLRYGASLPFYIFQTGTSTAESDTGYTAVRRVQSQIHSSDSNTKLVFDGAFNFPSRGLMKDIYHYKQAGYNEMGVMGAKNIVSSQ